MKATRWIALAAFAAAVTAAPAAWADAAAEKLAKDKGCTACHANDKKMVGPAYKEVAKKYKGDAGAAAKLAEKVIKGGQGAWGAVPMPPNKVTPDEAKQLVTYVLAM